MSAAHPVPAFITSRDGVQIAVYELGGPSDGAAPVLLFSHATGFHGTVWEPLASHVTDRYRCVALDLRGHGQSDLPLGSTLDWRGMGADAIAVVDAIGSEWPLHGVGHSMGGAALMMASVHRPGAFRSLWLYEPAIVPSTFRADSGANPMAEAAARRRPRFDSYDAALANFASKPPLNQLHPDALRAYVDGGFAPQDDGSVALRCRPETEASVFREANRSGVWDLLPQVDVPVAIVAGRPEPFGPVKFAPGVAASLPRGTLIERPELGHFGPLEDPGSMASDVVAWVTAHP